jgi:predicted flap endonuclease-1-like 5' DNA nuclease
MGRNIMAKNQSYQPEKELPPGLGSPAVRALNNAGYTNLRQLAGVRESELKKLHGMGPKGIRILKDELSKQGLSLS